MYDYFRDLSGEVIISTGIVLVTFFNFKNISSLFFRYIITPPGVGKLYTKIDPKSKRKNVFVDTNNGKIRIPYYKLPSLDTDIYFFENPSIVTENNLISREAFNASFKDDNFFPCNKYDLGLIPQFHKLKDYKEGKRISGFISSIMEDCVFVFKLDDEIIDYDRLLIDYEEALEGDIYKLDIENVKTKPSERDQEP